jgi:hypothetical protein
MAQGDLVQRMLGAATLNIDTFEEVEADETATTQAAAVVGMVAVASAIGAVGEGGTSLFMAPVAQIFAWLIWAGVTYLIGTKIFNGTATWGELLRTLGFAQAPWVLLLFAVLPFLGGPIRFAVAIWMLVAGVIAVRQALDFSTGKAVLTVIIGWFALIIPAILFGGFLAFGG